jgi:cytoplasmic FMR1 interacting protein
MIHLKGVRDEHIKYTAELARYSNEVTTTYKETPRTDQENRFVIQHNVMLVIYVL